MYIIKLIVNNTNAPNVESHYTTDKEYVVAEFLK